MGHIPNPNIQEPSMEDDYIDYEASKKTGIDWDEEIEDDDEYFEVDEYEDYDEDEDIGRIDWD
jgi:hypothetical protein